MGRIRSLLLGSKIRIATTIVVVLVASIGGAIFTGVLAAPSVNGVENRFGETNSTSTVIETDMGVHNPNPFGVNLGGMTVDYTVEMNDVQMAAGQKEGVNIKRGNSTLQFRTGMDNTKIPAWWTSHVRNGEHTDLAVRATVHSSLIGQSFGAPAVERSIDTDILSAFNSTEPRPINAERAVVEDPVLWLNRTGAAWGAPTEARTPIEIEFVLYNPKPWAVPIAELGYNVTMNDVDVGEGRTDQTYVVPPGSTKTIRTTVTIETKYLDEWWVSHLQNNQQTDLVIDFYANVDLSSAGASDIRVPLDDMDYEKSFETDVFGNKNADGGGSAPDSDEGTTTPDGSEETTTESGPTGDSTVDTSTDATPTSAPTGTPTPEASTDDDGGVLDRSAQPVAAFD